ncbi:MAG: 50S ribosomal protein L3 [Spirochaetes bacterium]|nr:50S ribosomal protein L3 [Spirochaetota bacterium]
MVGLIGKKEGMTQFFLDEGDLVPVTLIKVEKNVIVNKKLIDKDGYNALVVGSVDKKEKKVIKSYKGQFPENVLPKKYLKEFRIDNPKEYEIGNEIGLEILNGINYVDVTGVSKGKGFQGVIKRHGFSGGPSSHGSKFHRQNGSTGQSAYPSRGFKGVKRAGRMGNDKVTSQSLKVVAVDEEKNLVMIKGCIPGIRKGIVYLRKAIKKK